MATMTNEPQDDSTEENAAKKHRRLQTYDLGKGNWEGTVRRGTTANESNATMAKYVASLSNEQRAQLTKASNDLRAERTIKRLELKLEEAMDQRNQATEIVKNLAKENEDLKIETEELKSQVQQKEHDLKLLEKDYTLMNELFEEEKAKYEVEIQKMDKLKREMVEREEQLELRAKEQEYLETEKKNELHRHIKSFDGFEENEKNELNTPIEKKLYAQFQEEKRRSTQLKQQMDTLLTRLEDQSRLEEENVQLKEYCNKLEQDNAQQLEEANEINASVHNEVIKLAHRNAHLEQEKKELMRDVENKSYEISMLRKSLELAHKNSNGTTDNERMDESNAMADEIYNTQKNELLYAFDQPDFENVEPEVEIDSTHIDQTVQKPEGKEPHVRQAFVPDVLKEYLHLTATAVKIKYPKVNIESDELIKKVQFEPYFNYFERMTQIMQAEEAKLRKPKTPTAKPEPESFFSKMKHKMFGVSAPPTTSVNRQQPSPSDNNTQSLRDARNLRRKNTAENKEATKSETEKEKPLAEQPFRSVSPALPADQM